MTDPNYTQEHPFVAVEFDTFPNVDLGDPDHDHVGIDVNSMWTPPYTTEWFTMNDGRTYEAEITYDTSSNQLVVNFLGFKDNVPIQQNYAHEINLSSYLPEQVQFGFSSATGVQFELHSLCSWSFNSSFATLGGERGKGKRSLHRTGLLIGGSVAVVVLGVFTVFCLKGKRYCSLIREYGEMDASLDTEFESVGPKRFPYQELVRATNNFAEENKLGEGGFGGVYKGLIRRGGSNACVAIKKVSQESKQGVKEYASEVKIIGRLSHKNLVKLLGWCHEMNNLLLVYEFMPNGSLDFHLFGNNNRNLLKWPARYNIAQGLASAILYLHEECEQCVVHRDIKPSNIMLDSNFNTKLGDFGLARFSKHGRDSTTTAVAGTKGYMAPEYLVTGKATSECVYSFGVVALELACGQKPIVHVDEEHAMLVEWVWGLYGRGEILGAADKSLFSADNDGEFEIEHQQQLQRVMILGLWSAHPDYTMRPTIRQALNVLNNNEAPLPTLPPTMPVPAYVSPSFSDVIASSSSSSSTNSSSLFVSSAAISQASNQRSHIH